MRNVTLVTGGRQDYSLYYYILKEIEMSEILDARIIATALHLSHDQGYTYREIEQDGFQISEKVEMLLSCDFPECISKSTGIGTIGFADIFKKQKPDILLINGDRFEMLSAASAALSFNIPIAHIGGGQVSEGVIDNTIRQVLTKFSHIHFVNNEMEQKRVLALGEEPWRIHISGSSRLDFQNPKYGLPFNSKEEVERHAGISFDKKVILFTYHPVTLEFENTQEQIKNILDVIVRIDKEIDADFVILYPNLDTSGSEIIRELNGLSKERKNVKVFKSLSRTMYLSLLKYVDIMVGNSSSGIIEAPSFKLPFVNIGNRQRGRDKAENVIDVSYDSEDIYGGIKKALADKDFLDKVNSMVSPFGDGHASERIVRVLEQIDIDEKTLIKKIES
jgi:GDP/UDP-N,N'-diacetylbacillosamine 2-epimerase (hydrolysing)